MKSIGAAGREQTCEVVKDWFTHKVSHLHWTVPNHKVARIQPLLHRGYKHLKKTTKPNWIKHWITIMQIPRKESWRNTATYLATWENASTRTDSNSLVNSGPFLLLFWMTSFAKYRKVSFLLDFAEKGEKKKRKNEKTKREFAFISHFFYLESLTVLTKMFLDLQSKKVFPCYQRKSGAFKSNSSQCPHICPVLINS